MPIHPPILDSSTFYAEVVSASHKAPIVCIVGSKSEDERETCLRLLREFDSPRLFYACVPDLDLPPPCTIVVLDHAIKRQVAGVPTAQTIKRLLNQSRASLTPKEL